MAAGSTYTPIATTTVSGTGTSSVTFNSFSGYTDIRLIIGGGANGTVAGASIRLNGDTGTNYSDTRLVGSGTAASSASDTSQDRFYLFNLPDTNGVTTVDFMNYANATTYKTLLCRMSGAAYQVWASVGLWRSTAAITSFEVFVNGSQFANGTTLTIYGIAAA